MNSATHVSLGAEKIGNVRHKGCPISVDVHLLKYISLRRLPNQRRPQIKRVCHGNSQLLPEH